jgi:hypothetical protein
MNVMAKDQAELDRPAEFKRRSRRIKYIVLLAFFVVLFVASLFRESLYGRYQCWRLARDLASDKNTIAESALQKLLEQNRKLALPYLCRSLHNDKIWIELFRAITSYGPDAASPLLDIVNDRSRTIESRLRAITLLWRIDRLDGVSVDDQVEWIMDISGLPLSARDASRDIGGIRLYYDMSDMKLVANDPSRVREVQLEQENLTRRKDHFQELWHKVVKRHQGNILNHLTVLLKSTDPTRRKAAIERTAWIHQWAPSDKSKAILDSLRESPDAMERLLALWGLLQAGEKEHLKEIPTYIRIEDEAVSFFAIAIASSNRYADAVSDMMRRLKACNPPTHRFILHHLTLMKASSAVPELARLTPAEVPQRIDYLRARGMLGDREAFPLLLPLMAEASLDINTREEIVRALEKICFGDSLLPLMGLDKNGRVEEDPLRLARIDKAIRAWRRWWDSCKESARWDQESGTWSPVPVERY